MTADVVLALVSELLKVAALLCLPLLTALLIIGLVISILQAVTQIQDASIGFVPRLLLFGVVLLLLAPWMLGRLTLFGEAMFARLSH
jgi:flagellar biosynthesis protein FliQ